MMNNSRTIAALDVGTGKMQAFVGEIIDGKDLNIVGMGQFSSADIKKGDILDFSNAAVCAQNAIANAERSSATTVRSVCLGISGTHIRGFRNLGSANVSGSDGIVRKSDVDRACDDAQSKTISDDKVFIQNVCCGYYLDDEYVSDPIGKKGTFLNAEFYMIYADKERVLEALHLVSSKDMTVEHLVINALAAARIVTTPQQREDGVLVLDIGCGTTDYAFIKYGKTFKAGAIPVGGDHLTNDMSFALSMTRKNADTLKRKFGKLVLTDEEKNASVWTEGDKQIGDRSISLAAISKILRLRMDELFTIVRTELEDYFLDNSVKEVVIVGGTSKLGGICAFAETFFKARCEEAKFSARIKPTLCHPEYAAALGLLDYALSKESANESKKTASGIKGIISKIFNF